MLEAQSQHERVGIELQLGPPPQSHRMAVVLVSQSASLALRPPVDMIKEFTLFSLCCIAPQQEEHYHCYRKYKSSYCFSA